MQERGMLAKERASDMYRLSSYFMSRTLSDMPMELLLPTIFVLISYFMVGLDPTAPAFFLTLIGVYLIVISAQASVLSWASEGFSWGLSWFALFQEA
jgi:VIT1/CCC1 family predicted Fe2+/Mn2+ transporter